MCIKILNIKLKYYILLFVLAVLSPEIVFSQIMTVKGNSVIHLKQGSVLSVNGGLKLESGASIVHDNAGISNLYISGKFNYLGTYSQNSFGILRFFGTLQDTISGNNLTIPQLWLMKTGSGSMLSLDNGTNLIIQQALRLISNHLLNIDRSDLTLEAAAMIYPDSTSNYTADPLTDPFSNTKHISTNGKTLTSGKIIRKLTPVSGLNADIGVRFPIGTVNDTTTPTARYYTPARYVFNADVNTIFGSGSWLSVKCIAGEHPFTEVKEVALKKYWKTDFNNIIVKAGGYNIRFNYNQNEVQGFEELYFLNLFYRPAESTYYINPGLGYGVEPINNRFYVDEVNKKELSGNLQLDGEWTAGQEEAISTFYYSRTNGNWNDPNTWSKQGYNGAPSPTYPSTENDKAFIGNGKTVTITATTPEINRTMIESTGRLYIPNPVHQLLGDSLYLKAGGTLAISNANGIRGLGSPLGQIQTTKIRSYSSDAIYEFTGANNQVTGPDIPDIVRSIVVNKNALTDTVSLSKSILIKDSLVVNQGCLHLYKNGNFSANGETGDTTNRQIKMRGGEFVMQSFPTKYMNGNFTAGTITFDGTGSFRVPSSESPSPGEPSVTQYYNLSFKGSRASNTFVTLDPTGELRIGGLLDISKLSFNANPAAERFLVTGSKVVFNGSGDQDIQTGYAAATGINYRLKFHELIIDGTGNKNIMNPNDAVANDNYALIRSYLRIKQGTLKSNNYSIKVLGNWKAYAGSTFNAGTGIVTFEADGKVTTIESNGTSFNNMRIMGTLENGYVSYVDSLNIAGNLEINPNSLRSLNSASLAIQGNWLNKGVFVANTGRVYFNGSAGDQTLTHSGTGSFYRATVNKNSGMVRITGDSLLKITNDLTLTKGNIGGRTSSPIINKPLIVDGTITRPGGTPGHVDGRLRLPTAEGAQTILFPVGLNNDYAAMKMDINGAGGAAGYLDAYVLLDTTAPFMGRTVIETQTPNGPELDSTKNVRKVWVLHADTSVAVAQRFVLANSRTYDIEFFFPASDVRNSALPDAFEIGQRDTVTGVTGTTNTNHWSKPLLSDRNPTSTKFINNQNFKNTTSNYFILGTPKIFTYYSIADGLFNNVNTWSTAGYLNTEPALRAPNATDHIRIGNGKTVTLNVSHTINTGRIFRVETGGTGYQNGHLVFGNDTLRIWGAGTFRLDSGAAVTILEQNGIVVQGTNSGAVRTTTRDYNFGTHNRGNFIYARNGAQATGNGLPASMQTLKVEKSSGTLTITGTSPVIKQVWDSLYIANGTADFSTVIMKLAGNLRIGATGTFTTGSATMGSDQNMNRDSTVLAGGFLFNGSNEQWIEEESADTTIEINFNRIGLAKEGGKVRARNNIKSNQFFFHNTNRANFDVQSYNKYLNCSSPTAPGILRKGANSSDAETNLSCLPNPTWGWVEGRLVRNAANNTERVFIVGTKYGYSPVHIIAAHTTSSADYIEVHVEEVNHPNFKANQINQNTNIQRYYEITRTVSPASTFSFASANSMKVGLIFTQDEPRGGIDPNTYSVFRLDSSLNWTRTNNIALLSNDNAYPNSATTRGVNVTATGLATNAIFAVNSQFSTSKSITLMVGEPSITGDRVFYSKNSGNWTSPSTWVSENPSILYASTDTGYAKATNAYNDYPRYNTGTYRDFAIIGDGDSIYFNKTDSLSLQYVLLEKSAGGVGKLVIPNERFIVTDQFVQKNGGKLIVGSANGVTNLAYNATASTQGNIRALTANSIINFDWNQYGINSFSFMGTSSPQATGAGLPTKVSSLEINNTASNGYVNLTKDSVLTILDSLVFLNGTLRNNGTRNDLAVKGDIVNHNNSSGFNTSSTRFVLMDSTLNQKVRGNADSTIFPTKLTINKTSGTVSFLKNVRLNSILDVLSNTIINLSDNRTLTFGDAATINNIDSFSVNRMFKVSGGPNTGQFRKTFATNASTSNSFTFPVGEDSLGLRTPRYGEAKYDLNTMNFTAGSNLTFSLFSKYPHPNAPTLSPNMLNKYWSTNTTGITLNANGNVNTRFRYNDAELKGNVLQYAPAIYRRATSPSSNDPGWSSTIFGATNLQIDTTNKYIITTGAKTLPYYDWTAGEPGAFAKGKVYWSRQNGNWNDPNTWTNINTQSGNHNIANDVALNYPGYYAGDTVYIGSTHTVTYNATVANSIDSVGIGITSPSTSPALKFATVANVHKKLDINGSLMLGSTGLIYKDSIVSVSSIDTLSIRRDFSNLATTANRGVIFYPLTTANIRLRFVGNDSTRIVGEGIYKSLGTVRILKSDSIWNTINKSRTFSNRFTLAVTTPPYMNFELDAGMYVHDVDTNITLSKDGDGNIFLGDLVGLVVRRGNIIFQDGLICGQNASVWLLGGNMTIGNQKSENFLYESVTIVDIEGSSRLTVAGALRRRFTTSNVDFRLKDNALIEVMTVGAVTNSSERRAAFDFGEANSFFNMSGNSRVLIYRPMDTSVAGEKDPDYLVSATTYNVTGGTVQFGDPSLNLTVQPFSLIASVPFWNLDIAKTYGKDLFVGSSIATVRNDLTIRSAGIFNQNGNNLNIGGDLTIAGQYKTGTLGTRRVSFFGDTTATPPTKRNQTIMISSSSNDNFYDFSVGKADSGTVFLSNSGSYTNSNLVISNTLEFSVSNRALINTGTGRYVQVGTNSTDLGSIQRFGAGHVNGFLRRWINNGVQNKLFTVGTQNYTPVQFLTTSGTGTEGLLSVKAFGTAHPNIASATDIQTNTHVDRYWQITPIGASQFALGAGRSFNLTTYFLKGATPTGDVKPGTSFGIFEHFRYTPYNPSPGTWFTTVPYARSDSSTTSSENIAFGDFAIGEISGLRFFSAQDGDWNSLSTWVMGSYAGTAASRAPIVETDRVFIGNGKTVTIQNSSPKVRSVTVEVFNTLPGKLRILDERYLRGLSFSINDNCFLATDDAFGFTSISGATPNIGAIRSTSIRTYGKGTYEYIGEQGQAMGDGPINPKTIIVNNSGNVTNGVSFSPFTYTVEDSILVQLGGLEIGDGLVNLKGQLVVLNGTYVNPNFGTLNLNGAGNQHVVMNDTSGVTVFNLRLTKNTGNMILKGTTDSAKLKIVRNLDFYSGNTAIIDGRTNNKKVVLLNDTSFITRTGTGHIDGYLLKQFSGTATGSYKYEIGFGSLYMPATLNLTAGTGTAGLVAGYVNSPPNTSGARISPTKKINYYWELSPWTTFLLGTRTANTTFVFPASEIANLTGGVPNNAVLLRKSIPVENPLWKSKVYSELTWNVSTASVQIANPANYWTGLGEFYIGEKKAPTFYSRQTGLWNDNNTWTYDPTHIGDPLSPGEYPNPDPGNNEDNVYVGLNHTVTLNVAEPQIDTLIVRNNSKLDVGTNSINCANCAAPPKGLFDLRDNATVAFGGTSIPSTTTSIKNFIMYGMSSGSTVEYTGTQTITSNPFGPFFTSYPGNVRISGPGIKLVNTPVIVNGNFYVNDGASLQVDANSLKVYGSIFNSGSIMNTNIIEIGN